MHEKAKVGPHQRNHPYSPFQIMIFTVYRYGDLTVEKNNGNALEGAPVIQPAGVVQ